MKFVFLSVLFFVITISAKKEEQIKDLSNGYPSAIEWVEFDKAVGIAKDLNKPIFFLIHKTWCGACKSLKRELKQSQKTDELITLSRKFVMVNVEDDDEPEDEKYSPDGGYIPRILFLDTDGNPLKTNNERKYKNNKYFYPLAAQIIDGMERALLEFGDDEGAKKEEKIEKKTEKKVEKKEEKKEKKQEKKEEKVEKKKEEKKEKKKDEKKKDKKEKKNEKKEKKSEKKTKKEQKEEL